MTDSIFIECTDHTTNCSMSINVDLIECVKRNESNTLTVFHMMNSDERYFCTEPIQEIQRRINKMLGIEIKQKKKQKVKRSDILDFED
jgi:hypothetical protein